MADQDPKHQDKKTEDEKGQTPQDETTPRPDPVGERNYAISAPVVRPEGEGTPGPMRQSVPPAVPTQEPQQPMSDAERHASETASKPVGEEVSRRPVATPAVPVVTTSATRVHPGAPDVRKAPAKVAEPEHPKHDARKK
jgi:hypothetical protein